MSGSGTRVRVLVVGFVQSIHTVRAVEPMSKLGWDVHVVPANPYWPHPDWRDVTLHLDPGFDRREVDPTVQVRRLEPPPGDAEPVIEGLSFRQRAAALAALVEDLDPDLVDSMEIQHGGYVTLEARRLLGDEFPVWIVHNWGSDIYYYGRNPRHLDRLKGVLQACDYYGAECHRDVGLARMFGCTARALPVSPNTGGFDFDQTRPLRRPGPTSERRGIALKATQSFVYRPDTALDALEQCADLLGGHRLFLYTASSGVTSRAQRLSALSGMELEVVSTTEGLASHERILSMHGESRISISLSMSDAICTSFLEAMVMGSFPIQSDTGCAEAWAEDGKGAIFVDPDDPGPVAEALRRALTDDDLVDAAAESNMAVAAVRLDRRALLTQAMDVYERIAAEVLSGGADSGGGGFDADATAERLLAIAGDCGCGSSGAAASEARRQFLALRYLTDDQPGFDWEDLLPRDASREDWSTLVHDLVWVLDRQAEQMRAERLDWVRGRAVPDTQADDGYDSDLVERDSHIEALRLHIHGLQQSLDGFHRDLEQAAGPSLPRRALRRLVPPRIREWTRRQLSRLRAGSTAAGDG